MHLKLGAFMASSMTNPLFNPHDPVQLAQVLIRCPSVTPQEGGALALIETVLKNAGFETHRLVFSEPGTADVENLFARIGAPGPAWMFAGHTDVVPPGDIASWRYDPFAGVIDKGKLYGRGAADMKGGVAAMVSAALRYRAEGGQRAIAFLLTGDEEGPAVNGTVKLLAWARARGERFSQCLLAEPTNPEALGDAIKIGRRGSLTFHLTVRGVQGHAAYPHLAHNPIPDLIKLITVLIAEPLDQGSDHFDRSNLEITTVDVGNLARNVIPAEARAAGNIRFNDHWTLSSLKEWIRARLDQTGIPYDLAFDKTGSESFLTEPGAFVDSVVAAIEAETGRRPALSTAGGTSDARFIKECCPVVEFGLVGKTMHQVDERVSVADLEALTQVFVRILRDVP